MAEDVAEATDSLPKEAGLVGLDGPLDQLDLTNMLAESFEPQEQDSSEETSPGGDAVEEAEPVEESTEEAGDTEHVLSQEESETESDAEAEPGEQPEWFQRRIDRFTKKLRLAEEERDELEGRVQDLSSKLEQNSQQLTNSPVQNPLGTLKTDKELQDTVGLSERRLEFAENMEDLLLEDAEQVENVLRKQGVELKDSDGEEDFSLEKMTRFVREIRRDSERKLNKWIPQRSAEIKQSVEFNAQAEKLYPWLNKADSQEMKLFNQVLSASPQAAMAPNYKLELARYVRGYMAELGEQGKKITPKRVVAEPGRPTSAPAPKEGKAARYDESKKRVFSNRDQRGLTDFVGTLIN